MTSDLPVCPLCGLAFAILIPETAEETESDKFCSDCLRLALRTGSHTHENFFAARPTRTYVEREGRTSSPGDSRMAKKKAVAKKKKHLPAEEEFSRRLPLGVGDPKDETPYAGPRRVSKKKKK